MTPNHYESEDYYQHRDRYRAAIAGTLVPVLMAAAGFVMVWSDVRYGDGVLTHRLADGSQGLLDDAKRVIHDPAQWLADHTQ